MPTSFVNPYAYMTKGASMATKGQISKGDRVKVAFEGVVTFKNTFDNIFSVRADDGREVEYFKSDHLTRVVPVAPPKGSVVKTSKGTWIRLASDDSSWYLVDKNSNNNYAWSAMASKWETVFETGFQILN